jgi:ketosteroid isomerase-like protein
VTTADILEVEAANERLYAAFEAADLDTMKELWIDGPLASVARCVHPGSEAIVGRESVLRSWALLMANTEYLQFIVTETDTVVEGDLAVVTCTENVLSSGGDDRPLGAGRALTTNAFLRVEGAWRIWLHHASPVLSDATAEIEEEQ